MHQNRSFDGKRGGDDFEPFGDEAGSDELDAGAGEQQTVGSLQFEPDIEIGHKTVDSCGSIFYQQQTGIIGMVFITAALVNHDSQMP